MFLTFVTITIYFDTLTYPKLIKIEGRVGYGPLSVIFAWHLPHYKPFITIYVCFNLLVDKNVFEVKKNVFEVM